jgi:signal transduction histidine kinase
MLKQIPFSYRISLLYIFFGSLWILFSDQAVMYITEDPHKIHLLSTYKGWLFIAVTGIMLFYLVRNEIRRRTVIYNQLLQAKKKGDESERLKTTFLSNLSHYIRTPMNGILGFVELLEDKDLSPEKHQVFLSYINELSHHLLQTLNSIIEISKIQEGQAKLHYQSFNVNKLIDRIVDTARMDIMEKSKPITISAIHGFASEGITMVSDKDKIVQILSNLMSNAINFTDKGVIEIGSSKSDEQLTFWVSDTGRGIPNDRVEMLFSGFLQNTSTTCIEGEGAGLGLPLTSELAKLLGGKIWLESTSEKGSKFCFSIPYNPH